MKTTLRLELPALRALNSESRVAFALLDRELNLVRTGELPLSGVAAGIPGSRVEAILHPGDSIITSVQVPPLPVHRLGAAVTGAVEPLLLGDVDGLAIAHGPRAADGQVTVAWSPRDGVARALETLAQCGLTADALIPAPLALPLTESGWTAQVRDGYIVVRCAAQTGYCWQIDAFAPDDGTEPAAAALLLALEQDTPPAIAWIEPQPAHWTAPIGVQSRTLPASARWQGGAPTWSLALAALRPQHRNGSPWRRPLMWAAAAAAVWLLGLNIQSWQMGREERALRQHMTTQVKTAFPDIPVIVDPLLQAQQRRDALRAAAGKFGDSDFLPLALSTAQLLPQAASNLTTLTFADAELRMRLVDDAIGMTNRPVSPSAAAQAMAPHRLGLRSRSATQANGPAVRAEIDPAIVQRAQTLSLRVDRIDGEWRIRAANGDDRQPSANGVRIQTNGAPR